MEWGESASALNLSENAPSPIAELPPLPLIFHRAFLALGFVQVARPQAAHWGSAALELGAQSPPCFGC